MTHHDVSKSYDGVREDSCGLLQTIRYERLSKKKSVTVDFCIKSWGLLNWVILGVCWT